MGLVLCIASMFGMKWCCVFRAINNVFWGRENWKSEREGEPHAPARAVVIMVITAKIVFGCFHCMKVWGYCIYVECIQTFWILGLGSWVDIKMWVFIHCVILVLVFAHSRRIGDLITATTGECAYKRTVNNSITLQSTKAPSIHWRANVCVCVHVIHHNIAYATTTHKPPHFDLTQWSTHYPISFVCEPFPLLRHLDFTSVARSLVAIAKIIKTFTAHTHTHTQRTRLSTFQFSPSLHGTYATYHRASAPRRTRFSLMLAEALPWQSKWTRKNRENSFHVCNALANALFSLLLLLLLPMLVLQLQDAAAPFKLSPCLPFPLLVTKRSFKCRCTQARVDGRVSWFQFFMSFHPA